MAGLYNVFKIYTPGEILTAADLNATDQQHVTFNTALAARGYSETLDQSRTQTPSTTLSVSIADELARLREKLRLLGGVQYWDQIIGPSKAAFALPKAQIILPLEAATLPDGTAGNAFPAIFERVSTAAIPAGNTQPKVVETVYDFDPVTPQYLMWKVTTPLGYKPGELIEVIMRFSMPETPVGTHFRPVVGAAPIRDSVDNVSLALITATMTGPDNAVVPPSGVEKEYRLLLPTTNITENQKCVIAVGVVPASLDNATTKRRLESVTVEFSRGQFFLEEPGMQNPMTVLGDLIVGGNTGTPQRLGVGAEDQVLTVQGGIPSWIDAGGALTSPMTNLGDLIQGGVDGEAARLPIGGNGQVLTVVGGAPSWEDANPTFPILAPAGSEAAPSYAFALSPDTGIAWNLDEFNLAFVVRGRSHLSIYDYGATLNGLVNVENSILTFYPPNACDIGINGGEPRDIYVGRNVLINGAGAGGGVGVIGIKAGTNASPIPGGVTLGGSIMGGGLVGLRVIAEHGGSILLGPLGATVTAMQISAPDGSAIMTHYSGNGASEISSSSGPLRLGVAGITSWSLDVGGTIRPWANNVYDLGAVGLQIRALYVGQIYINGVLSAALTNPMTTPGDMIFAGAGGIPARLPVGATPGHVLTITGAGTMGWAVPPSGSGGGVTWPLLALDGTPAAPSYSFASAPTIGLFLTTPEGLTAGLRLQDAGGGFLTLASYPGAGTEGCEITVQRVDSSGYITVGASDLVAYVYTTKRLDLGGDLGTWSITGPFIPYVDNIQDLGDVTHRIRDLYLGGHIVVAGTPLLPMANPMTTPADLIIGGVAGAPTRFGKGADTQVLSIIAGALAWATPTGMPNPMTTAGDIIIGGVSGAPGRLPAGPASNVLTIVGGVPAWAPSAASGVSLVPLHLENARFPDGSASNLFPLPVERISTAAPLQANIPKPISLVYQFDKALNENVQWKFVVPPDYVATKTITLVVKWSMMVDITGAIGIYEWHKFIADAVSDVRAVQFIDPGGAVANVTVPTVLGQQKETRFTINNTGAVPGAVGVIALCLGAAGSGNAVGGDRVLEAAWLEFARS